MCGIFAWAGKTPNQFNKAKLDILGLYNIERGKHSCGVTTDGDIFIGVDSNKLYSDFLSKSNYIEPNKYPIVIGHTRHATGGAHNTDNAHPFGFGSFKDHYKFIGVHNGSLVNHSDIAKKYDIKEQVQSKKNNIISYRSKIDSEILLESIFKDDSFKVLEEYDGAAALMFTNLEEPDVLYCYHGKSRKFEDTGEPIEERPLFFWQEKRNSLFISSLASSLYAIGAHEDEVKIFNHNIVYKIKDGNVSTAVKFKINRDDQCQSTRYKKHTTNLNQNANCSVKDEPYKRESRMDRYKDKEDTSKVVQLPMNFGPLADFNIYNDEPIGGQNIHGNKIYMSKLRYWRNGHTVTGVYTWVPKFGFFYLADKVKEAEGRFYDFINKYFYVDDFVSHISDVDKKNRSEMFVPFLSTDDHELIYPQLFFFFDGIRIKTKADYNACTSGVPQFNWEALSMCACHPVINLNFKKRADNAQGIIYDGAPYNDTIAPLGSDKIYTIKDGNCINIQLKSELDVTAVAKIDDVVAKILKQEKDIMKQELLDIQKEAKVEVEEVEDLLDKDLDEMFKDSLFKFPSYSKRLGEYKSIRAKKAKEIIDTFVEFSTKLLRVDITD